jgi:hypothetical protein
LVTPAAARRPSPPVATVVVAMDLAGVPVLAAEVAPTHLITPGNEVTDGVTFLFEAVYGGKPPTNY